jgi:hypothetical protein
MDDTAARRLDHADDEIDGLHDGLDHQLLDGNWQHGTAAAVRTALIARHYERYADHAVSVARLVAFLAGKSDLDTSSDLTPVQLSGQATRRTAPTGAWRSIRASSSRNRSPSMSSGRGSQKHSRWRAQPAPTTATGDRA